MRFVGFVVAGGIATLVNYGIFAALLFAGVHYLAASATGYLSGIAVSFGVNRRFVFRSGRPIGPQLARYALAYGLALAAQLSLLALLVRLSVPPLYANAVALVVVVTGNYFVIAKFVFPPTQAPDDRKDRVIRPPG
jgi:putative flippase GtrA